jgi:serine/threonine-protein kinase OSR1/STK39
MLCLLLSLSLFCTLWIDLLGLCRADIWSFGITALELAHGHAPFSKYPPMKVLLMTLQNAPPGLDLEQDKKFSKSFKEMIAMCLVKDPSKRPSAEKLLRHSFFKHARSFDYIARHVLEGLPPLGERVKNLKITDANRLAQKKMPFDEQEEKSQVQPFAFHSVKIASSNSCCLSC